MKKKARRAKAGLKKERRGGCVSQKRGGQQVVKQEKTGDRPALGKTGKKGEVQASAEEKENA